MEIRQFVLDDYDQIHALWEECGFKLGKSDSKDEIKRFIEINSQTSLVGVLAGELIACVLGGFDGRRGLVHHLCVHPDSQGKGYGSQILMRLEAAFREKGIIKMSFWVLASNIGVVKFYDKLGYGLRHDIVTMSKDLT